MSTKFDWVAFLDRHRVPYNTRGPNTPSGAVTVGCPFCGATDPSDHMVIWRSGHWSCWRNHAHRGGSAAKLVQALIRCSLAEAQRITATTTVAIPADLSRIAEMLTSSTTLPVRELSLPDEFKPLRDKWGCAPFLDYIRARGIKVNTEYLQWRYNLHYCTTGSFKGRLIFPVTYKGKLISWTGRSIYPVEKLRYKSLTTNADVAAKSGLTPAVAPINHYFMWHDWLSDQHTARDAGTFVLVEGPFDALKINVLGEPYIVATCWTGSEPTAQQIELLHTLVRPFKRRVVLSDSDMPQKAHRIADKLSSLGFRAIDLPPGVDDPAEIDSFKQLKSLLAC